MQSPPSSKRKYRFGLFELDSASGELTRQGVRVRLQDQPFRLLIILLEHAGHVVSHEELRTRLWPAGTYVEFDGSLKAALKRLRAALGDSADNPIFIETVPRRGHRFIAPVTFEALGARPAAPAESIPATTPGSPAGASAGARPTSPAVPRPQHFVSVAVGLVLLAGLAWWVFSHPSGEPSKSSGVVQAAIPVRRSVAVLGFRNVSARPEDDWLATAFSEMLDTELGSGEKLRLVSAEEVTNLRLTSPWPQTGTLRQQTAARVGAALNSDVLVLGSYTTLGKGSHEQLRLDVSLQDARTGDVLAQVAQTGYRDDLFRLTSEVGAELREKLGLPAVTEDEQPGLLASMPVSPDAARFYALGIAKLRDFDARAAKDLLLQAVAADPKFPLAHAALAAAWGQLGYEQKHKEEAKKAMDLSGSLPQVEKLQVEGDYYESLPNHEKAASIYSALFELFPDNVDYGLQLADAQNAAGHTTEARATVARLRRLPAPASDDPRLDLTEANLIVSNRWRDALVLIHSAEAKAQSQDKKLLYAGVRLRECIYLAYGEHPDQAGPACTDAHDIYQAAGNNLGAADALRVMADLQGRTGNIEQARATYQKALKILAGQGEHLKTGTILNNMAIGYTNEGNLERGEELYRQAKLHFEMGGDPADAATALVNIGDISYLRGDLSAAASTYQRVIAISASIEGKSPAYPMQRLADLRLSQGRVKEAHHLLTAAIDSLHGLQNSDAGDCAAELGDVLAAEGNSQAARRQYQRAIDIRRTLGKTNEIMEVQESLAELDLDERHPDLAEPLLRPAIAQFEKEKSVPDAISAYTLLSRSFLEQNKLNDAAAAIQRAAKMARGSPNPALMLPIEIQAARVDLAANSQKTTTSTRALAMKRLRSVSASAKKERYYLLECEARLALAEAEFKTDPRLARSQLNILESETRNRGLLLLANRAHALLAPPTTNARLPGAN